MISKFNISWLAAVMLLAAACSDDKPAPAPDPQSLALKTVIDGKYWSSTESFIYEKNGEEIVDRKSSLAALHWDTDRRSLLGVFSFRTDDSSIDTYDLTPYDPSEESELLLYRGLYSLASDGKTVRLTANDPEIAQKNVYAGMTLQLRSIAEDCAEFDMEINDFVRQQWADIFEESPVAITKIRVTWRMLTDDQIAEYRNFQDPIVVFPE